MNHFSKTVKISSKGQVTLPRQIRDYLKEDLVMIIADEHGVRIEPVRALAGGLKEYAKEYVPLDEVRRVLAARLRNSGPGRP